jgi:hypothetical protein
VRSIKKAVGEGRPREERQVRRAGGEQQSASKCMHARMHTRTHAHTQTKRCYMLAAGLEAREAFEAREAALVAGWEVKKE